MTNDLCEVEDLSGFPGAPFSQEVVDAAVANLRAHAGWHIAPSRTETLELDCAGGARVPLPSLRVTAVSEVRDTSSDTPVVVQDFRWSKAGILSRSSWPCGFQALEVDLTHGYDKCPPELLGAIAAGCEFIKTNRMVAAQAAGPFSQTFRDGSTAGAASDESVARYVLPSRP